MREGEKTKKLKLLEPTATANVKQSLPSNQIDKNPHTKSLIISVPIIRYIK